MQGASKKLWIASGVVVLLALLIYVVGARMAPSYLYAMHDDPKYGFLHEWLREDASVGDAVYQFRYRSPQVALVLLSLIPLFWTVCNPAFRAYWNRKYPLSLGDSSAGAAPDAAGEQIAVPRVRSMSTGRKRMAVVLLLLIVLPHLYDMVTNTEQWPFSQYPMYRTIGAHVWASYQYVGVTAEGEMPLDLSVHAPPLIAGKFSVLLRKRMEEPGGEELARQVLTRLAERYESLRAQGKHDGPPLHGLRLYRYEWRFSPDDAQPHEPDEKQLLAEVKLAR